MLNIIKSSPKKERNKCYICYETKKIGNYLQTFPCSNEKCCQKDNWLCRTCYSSHNNSEYGSKCPLCRAPESTTVNIRFDKTSTDVYLNAIVSRKKSLCKKILLCLKCLLNINSECHFYTVINCLMSIFASIGFFTVIYICLITIFCLKNEGKTLCFECNIIAILLSILFVVLAINYLKKIEKEKKINSDCLSNFICFVVFISFSTLITFVEDCSRDNWIYLLSPIFGFCTCFCCVKYNQKIT
jgi:hypothetical protein